MLGDESGGSDVKHPWHRTGVLASVALAHYQRQAGLFAIPRDSEP
jgi:hypothetical protein